MRLQFARQNMLKLQKNFKRICQDFSQLYLFKNSSFLLLVTIKMFSLIKWWAKEEKNQKTRYIIFDLSTICVVLLLCLALRGHYKSWNCKQGGQNKSLDSLLSSFWRRPFWIHIIPLLDPLGGCQATAVALFLTPKNPDSRSGSSSSWAAPSRVH